MNYEKPEIIAIGNAAQVVESAAKLGEHFDTQPFERCVQFGGSKSHACRALACLEPGTITALRERRLEFAS